MAWIIPRGVRRPIRSSRKNIRRRIWTGRKSAKRICYSISRSLPISPSIWNARFADQKGFDLIAQISSDLMLENLSLVVLGTGQADYERLFRGLAEKYPARVGLKIGYDNALAHKIEAGADIFLMPSRYEPSGLNQMYSLRYGTVPVVRATGGLDDTIQDFDPKTNQGTGFKFVNYDGVSLLQCVRAALSVYREPKAWQQLQKNGMAKDFSWKASAAAYVTLYEAAKRSRIPTNAVTSKP